MVPIPEGSETHSEESEYTDYGHTQEELDQPTALRGSGGNETAEREELKAAELAAARGQMGCSP
jgi:hypothetical protein